MPPELLDGHVRAIEPVWVVRGPTPRTAQSFGKDLPVSVGMVSCNELLLMVSLNARSERASLATIRSAQALISGTTSGQERNSLR